MNYGYDSVNCFTLILCGEVHLNNTLRKPVHEALRQRITVHYNFHGLSDQEVADYVLNMEWRSSWLEVSSGEECKELIISGRGSMLTVILTKYSGGSCLCIPSSLSLWLRSQ